jgi:hypothetical protein
LGIIFNATSKFAFFLIFFWILAIFAYFMKFVFSSWNSFTQYGKLQIGAIPIFSVSQKIGWILFYLFSCLMFFVIFLVNFEIHFSNCLLFFHSLRRLIEVMFVQNISFKKMHLINIGAGLLFYFLTPSFNSIKFNKYICFACISLNTLQFNFHFTLSKLNKYSIPQWIILNNLASPHYFVEILIYFIYFISSFSFQSFLMFIFVGMNLTHSSILTYKWYCEKFGNEFKSLN